MAGGGSCPRRKASEPTSTAAMTNTSDAPAKMKSQTIVSEGTGSGWNPIRRDQMPMRWASSSRW